jgi:hypothetical protein
LQEVLKKLRPETIEKIEGGVENMVQNGMKNDMWELFCCASMVSVCIRKLSTWCILYVYKFLYNSVYNCTQSY